MAAARPYGKGIIGLLKQGWNEIPGVMGTTVMALIGITMGTIGIVRNERSGQHAPTYKKVYTVYRPDDPRVNRPTHDLI